MIILALETHLFLQWSSESLILKEIKYIPKGLMAGSQPRKDAHLRAPFRSKAKEIKTSDSGYLQ
ncbi:hypothetical protein EFB08_16110 [Rufibacter latericius]|uniref:Uncharacterized protein n=1 Tax=Rufibacter latericius TaxID=2487040 RepID=A0A3M9MID8_9BACT|nr:hypothetical protein EFB08_16110 [Rufibacter latericius]